MFPPRDFEIVKKHSELRKTFVLFKQRSKAAALGCDGIDWAH
jgi:hypothetical protein